MKIILFILTFWVSWGAVATPQIPDKIKIGDEYEWLLSNPFIPFSNQPWIVEKLATYLGPPCSASQLGYIAYWEIINKTLYLSALYSNPCIEDRPNIPLDVFFPGAETPIPALWFSGELIIPKGDPAYKDRRQSLNFGLYLTGYEKYLIIVVQEGVVVSEYELSFEELYDRK